MRTRSATKNRISRFAAAKPILSCRYTFTSTTPAFENPECKQHTARPGTMTLSTPSITPSP
eukprot:1564679-Pyramimonas_sp.AAC.1